jgi:hypothetical protein
VNTLKFNDSSQFTWWTFGYKWTLVNLKTFIMFHKNTRQEHQNLKCTVNRDQRKVPKIVHTFISWWTFCKMWVQLKFALLLGLQLQLMGKLSLKKNLNLADLLLLALQQNMIFLTPKGATHDTCEINCVFSCIKAYYMLCIVAYITLKVIIWHQVMHLLCTYAWLNSN